MPGLVGLAGAWAHRVGYSVFLVPTLLAFALFTGRPLLTAVLESEWMLPVSGLRAFPREGLLDLQGGAVTFFLIGDFAGYFLSAVISLSVSPRSYRTCRAPGRLPHPGRGREGSGLSEHQARQAEGTSSVASGPGWKGSVASVYSWGTYLHFRQFIQPV